MKKITLTLINGTTDDIVVADTQVDEVTKMLDNNEWIMTNLYIIDGGTVKSYVVSDIWFSVYSLDFFQYNNLLIELEEI